MTTREMAPMRISDIDIYNYNSNQYLISDCLCKSIGFADSHPSMSDLLAAASLLAVTTTLSVSHCPIQSALSL